MEGLIIKLELFIIISLLTAHLSGDFLFQTNNSVENKNKPIYFLIHIFIVSGLSYLFAGLWNVWQIPVYIAVSHAVIDYLKLIYEKWKGVKTINIFLLDQVLHILAIVIIVLLFSGVTVNDIYWAKLFGFGYIKIFSLISGLILVTKVSGILIGMLVKPLLVEIKEPAEKSELKNDIKGIEGGGERIGYLERILIFFFVLNSVWGAIGFLVAAKSIFRFGELKDKGNRTEAEYILIGTLYSFSFGLLFSWLTLYSLNFI